MKFPEECMQSCLSVCRACEFVDKPAWLLSLVVVLAAGIGFVIGRFDISCSVRVLKQSLRSQQQVKQRFGQLLAYLPSFRGQLKVQAKWERWKHTRDKATVSTNERAERTLVDSPCSDSSSSSESGSQRKDKTSPLLAGSTRSTPTSSVCGLSSVESSPVGPGRARRNRSKDGDFLVDEHGPEAPLMQAISIPQLISRSKSSPDRQCSPSKHTLPAAAWMCGKDAFTLNANMDWLDLVESGLEYIYGEEWSRNVYPDDLNRSKETIDLAQSLKEPFQMEYRLKVGCNQFRWVLDIGKPRFRSNYEWLGFVGWRVDIHERKTIENNYYRYWELPHEFLVNWSGDGRFFDDFSPALPVFLGYTAEEFKAIPWLDLVHEDDKGTTNEAMEELCQGKAVASLTNRYRCKSGKVDGPAFVDSTGTYKWLNWTASDTFAACRDITSDVLAQEELRRSQQELQRITDAIPGGIFSYRVTPEGEESFPYVSKGALSLLGFEKKGSSPSSTFSSYSLWTPSALKSEEQAGRRIFGSNVHADDWLRLEEKMKLALEKRSHLDHDYRVVIGGETKWVRVHAVPRSQPSGSVEWSGIAWDITEQHQVVDALKEARDSAEKAAQAKGKFLAHMSHEIRTPMNAVIGMSALLLETDLTEEQREYASTIRTSGEVLLGIINDILDYSKVEAGKLELDLQPLNILQCVEESFDQVVPQATAKGLELTYAVSESIPSTVLGDSGRVRQILVNLLSNAVKFTNHGCISVNVEGHELELSPKSGRVPYRGKGRTFWEIEFSVRDSGIGIPEDRKSSLFQVMYLQTRKQANGFYASGRLYHSQIRWHGSGPGYLRKAVHVAWRSHMGRRQRRRGLYV